MNELYYISVHGDTPLGCLDCENRGTKMITDGKIIDSITLSSVLSFGIKNKLV